MQNPKVSVLKSEIETKLSSEKANSSLERSPKVDSDIKWAGKNFEKTCNIAMYDSEANDSIINTLDISEFKKIDETITE